ncbi:MAG: hypothetical protein ACI83D_000096 [Planctomycetota bacterium]
MGGANYLPENFPVYRAIKDMAVSYFITEKAHKNNPVINNHVTAFQAMVQLIENDLFAPNPQSTIYSYFAIHGGLFYFSAGRIDQPQYGEGKYLISIDWDLYGGKTEPPQREEGDYLIYHSLQE